VEYPSIEAIVQHLNHQSSCWPSDARPQEFPIPPGLRQGPSVSPSQVPTTGRYHPTSGYIYGVGKNLFDQLDDNEYADQRKENPYYPFMDEGEWELGKFLVENLNQTQINKFLKLKWVCTHSEAQSLQSTYLHGV